MKAKLEQEQTEETERRFQQEQTETAGTETEISVFSVTSCSKSLGTLPGTDQ
jgi:hypothetical protein